MDTLDSHPGPHLTREVFVDDPFLVLPVNRLLETQICGLCTLKLLTVREGKGDETLMDLVQGRN